MRRTVADLGKAAVAVSCGSAPHLQTKTKEYSSGGYDNTVSDLLEKGKGRIKSENKKVEVASSRERRGGDG